MNVKPLLIRQSLVVLAIILLSFSGTAFAEQSGNKNDKSIKALIVYYSWSNNTRTMAEFIQNQTGFDLEELELETPYVRDYEQLLDQVREEEQRGYLPPLKPLNADLSSYDVIFVGSPLWIYTLSSPVMSFLANNDLSGKTVIPFATRGTSSPDKLYARFAELCPDSTLLKGFDISRGGFYDAQPELIEWMNGLKVELAK